MSVRGWREEARQDRLVGAQIERDREAARAQLRIAERRAATQDRRDDQAARAAARQQARRARAARRAAMARRVRSRVMDLLFVPVIVVPAVLAWTAMAGFGREIYGPAGVALPAFSEGAMWAFAAAVTITRRRHPDKPLWHLRLGTWIFAAAAAAMNFAHGMAARPALHGAAVGAVMAMVSVAGVTAHQLITAGPRRSRAERDQARIARAVARREMTARRAAVRQAVAQLDGSGHVRLVYAPGLPAGITDVTAEAAALADDLAAGLGAWAAELGACAAAMRGAAAAAAPMATDQRAEPPDHGSADSSLAAWLTGGAVTVPGARPVPVLTEANGHSGHAPENVLQGMPEPMAAGRAPARPRPVPGQGGQRARKRAPARRGPATPEAAEARFADVLRRGQVPSLRQVKEAMNVGTPRAQELRRHLELVAARTE